MLLSNDQNKIKQEADENNKELKRLQFYGAGPKMAGYNVDKKEDKPKGKSINYEFDPVSKLDCLKCFNRRCKTKNLYTSCFNVHCIVV